MGDEKKTLKEKYAETWRDIPTFNEYQAEAQKTNSRGGNNGPLGLAYGILGIVGEAGEVAEKVKKFIRGDKGELDIDDLKKELGDVMWYIQFVCQALGFTMEEVASLNIAKLRKRHGEKYKHKSEQAEDVT